MIVKVTHCGPEMRPSAVTSRREPAWCVLVI